MRARVIVALILGVPAALVWACGGDTSTTDDGGVDSGNDQTVSNDTGTNKDTGTTNDTGTNDTGTTNDSGTNDTGTTTDSGVTDSGSTSFQCRKPTDCTSGFCCGFITFNGGTSPPNCTLVDAGSACASGCVSNISITSCKVTDTMRTCAANTDCTDAGTGYTKCCTVPFADASASFCWGAFFAQQAGGTCM